MIKVTHYYLDSELMHYDYSTVEYNANKYFRNVQGQQLANDMAVSMSEMHESGIVYWHCHEPDIEFGDVMEVFGQ